LSVWGLAQRVRIRRQAGKLRRPFLQPKHCQITIAARQNCARNFAVPLPCIGNYAKSAVDRVRGLESGMADHGEVEYATAEGNDYAAHEQTYENFITLVKVIMTIVIIIVIGMAYFLV
jgi:Bacterial aa3 type cytochrome c oxidase subunit IV